MPSPAEVIEECIGRYRLLEKIGEGGMGVVYMAEQREPITRKVALKIIKLGMDTRQVVARFEAERQALALMDHPNIAKILDAGATGSAESQISDPRSQITAGRPYFVMELVRGLPITQFCDQARLTTHERLALFLEVCSAVEHAHQKGIIHRDIKPTNILVTLHGDRPVPKIIDFGIAKAMQQRLTDKTLFTQFQQFVGTPAYTSPEQAGLSGLDIDTRSDIYGLGVLLYELLTGATPFDSSELIQAGLDGMRRTILEREPERPSTKLSTLEGSDLTRIAESRRAAPPALIHLLRGDLDWIVMKCLEKDRNRRYDTANGMAADLRRYLGNEAVLARPQTSAYRLEKWIRRHTAQFVTISLVAAALLAASVVSTWQAIRASRAQRAFREQAETATSVKDFLVQQVLRRTDSWGQKRFDPNDRILIERIAHEVEGQFTNQPLVEAEVRDALADGFQGLDDVRSGLQQVERALALRKAHLGAAHADTLTSAAKVGTALYLSGRHREADQVLDDAITAARTASQMLNPGAAETLFARGWRLTFEGQPEVAMPYLTEALDIFRQTLGEDHARTSAGRFMVAVATQDSGDTNKAETLFRAGIQQYSRSLGTNDPMVAVFLKGYGLLLIRMGRPDEAISNLEAAVAINQRSLGPDNQNTLEAETYLADALAMQGDTNKAIDHHVALHRRWVQYLPQDYARRKIRDIGHFFVRHHEYDKATNAFADLRRALVEVPPQRPDEWGDLLRATAALEGWPAAADLCEAQFDVFPDSLLTWLNKARVFRYVGRDDKYREVVSRALALPHTSNATIEQHLPIEIAGLAPIELTALTQAQQADIEARLHDLEAALPDRSAELRQTGHRAIGQYHLRTGDPARGLASLERSESAQSKPDAYTLYLKALCLKRLKRDGEALAALRKAEALLVSECLATPEHFVSYDCGFLKTLGGEARSEIMSE
ncbi:MAG TPA: tetratricopeptide repeat protein [Verrucomicrobiota bacterium]|nr:hypothetical protein [Verrucomicrobiales bacterium]HRI13812.1 tetratricopeptide repeat protein [Verrucomicrobiota bacterium]